MKEWFTNFAQKASWVTGHAATFIVAFAVIVIWGVSGPIFNYSDTWQLIINTGTTIVTFLMVFLIQNTQNRDTMAMQIKLDELIYRMGNANDSLLDLEELGDDDLDSIRKSYRTEARRSRAQGQQRDDVNGSATPSENDHNIPESQTHQE